MYELCELCEPCEPCVHHHPVETHLYSEELPAEEVLRLRVFLLCRARLRQATSPPSQVERQYGAASTLTSSPPSISHSQPVLELTGHTGC